MSWVAGFLICPIGGSGGRSIQCYGECFEMWLGNSVYKRSVVGVVGFRLAGLFVQIEGGD